MKQMAQQQLVQSDATLDAFDKLRVWRVKAENWDTASSFLAKFQSTAASLGAEERVKLMVSIHESGVESLKAVLSDQHANKICALHWEYNGEEDVNAVIPLLINHCPELASLWVEFEHHSAFDFVSSMLEHPNNKIKVLDLPYKKGDIARFFAALGQSQVSELAIDGNDSPEFYQGLCDYLAKDLLVRLKVWRVPSETMMSLADCTRLAQLRLVKCQPTTLTHLPKSTTKLKLERCTFVGGFDWSFLADSNVRELNFDRVIGVDGNHLGGALAVHLRAKGLDELRLCFCNFAKETLAAVGMEIGRIKELKVYRNLNDASIALIALTLLSPDSELRELELAYDGDMADSIETHFVPALKHPNCNLTKLSLSTNQPERKAAAKEMENRFYHRRALFALLQGQQVRIVYCPLRRLPVEMFRMVGMLL